MSEVPDQLISSAPGLTRQREVVLQVISEAEHHLTANEVFERAKDLRPTISFATVYNSLRYLKEAGRIAEIQFGNGASRYDAKTDRHDHALCTGCGKLIDLDLPVDESVLREAARVSQFRAESLNFTLRGLCPECV
jgi:Fur family transcriptional regulator, peroxide stress response regulator